MVKVNVTTGFKVEAKPQTTKATLAWRVKNFLRNRWRELPLEVVLLIIRGLRHVVPGLNMPMHVRLYLRLLRADGRVEDYGMVGVHLITNVGKTYIRDAWIGTSTLPNMKYHGLGTGTTAPAVTDTALVTELTTQYNPDNTRATGSLANNGTNVFRTVATNTVNAAAAVTEAGLFSQAATGGGVLFDRQTFAAINLSAGDSLQTTWDVTIG